MIYLIGLWLLMSFPLSSLLGLILRPTAEEAAWLYREDVSSLDSVTKDEGVVR